MRVGAKPFRPDKIHLRKNVSAAEKVSPRARALRPYPTRSRHDGAGDFGSRAFSGRLAVVISKGRRPVTPSPRCAVAKTCPSCGYQPIGPFTDNCPICAEPVRNVRSSRGSGAPPVDGATWVPWVLGAVAVAMLSVMGCCGLGVWRMGGVIQDARKEAEQAKAKAEADRRARTVVVPAAQLLQEFQNNPAAERKYKGKYLEISGVVERSGRDADDIPFVVLHAGDEQAKIKIECFFDRADDDAPVEAFDKGQTITVRGEYGGRVSNVRVRECVLVK